MYRVHNNSGEITDCMGLTNGIAASHKILSGLHADYKIINRLCCMMRMHLMTYPLVVKTIQVDCSQILEMNQQQLHAAF